MRRTVITNPINAGTPWRAKPLASGEMITRGLIADRFPGTAAGIPLDRLSRLTGVSNLQLSMQGIGRIDDKNGRTAAELGGSPVLVAFSATPEAAASRAVLAFPGGIVRRLVDLSLGRDNAVPGPLTTGEQGVFLYVLDRFGGDWSDASGPAFVVRGFLADFAQVADYLQAPPRWAVTVRFEGENLGGNAVLLFTDPLGPPRAKRIHAPIAATVQQWPVQFRLTVGCSRVPGREVRRLVPGDLIELDSGGHPLSGLGMVSVVFTNRGGTRFGKWLDRRRIRILSEKEREAEMKTTTQTREEITAVLESPEGEDTASLEVVIRVELGEVSMTVEAASQLLPGRIIALNRDAGSEVVLKVGNQVIGHGELVEYEGVLAVEVTAVRQIDGGAFE